MAEYSSLGGECYSWVTLEWSWGSGAAHCKLRYQSMHKYQKWRQDTSMHERRPWLSGFVCTNNDTVRLSLHRTERTFHLLTTTKNEYDRGWRITNCTYSEDRSAHHCDNTVCSHPNPFSKTIIQCRVNESCAFRVTEWITHLQQHSREITSTLHT